MKNYTAFVFAFAVMGATILGAPHAQASKFDKAVAIATEVATLSKNCRKVIADWQPRINEVDPKIVLNPAIFKKQCKNNYGKDFGDGLQAKMLNSFLDAGAKVVANNQAKMKQPGVGYKGFLPAVWYREACVEFGKTSGGAKCKLTAIPYRNPDNAPDDWEKAGYAELKAKAPKKPASGDAWVVKAEVDGNARVLMPEFNAKGCFTCHGLPAGGKDKTGGTKEGYQLDELAGAISMVLSLDLVE